MIQINPNVLGLKLEQIEFNFAQFADDTILILDDSQHSLQAALNVPVIFENISGLRMNMDKTKIIWIGYEKHSKDKLNVSCQLQ